MPDLVPVQLEGVTVWVEAAGQAPVPGSSKILEAGASDVAQRALVTAERLTDSIRAFCGRVIGSLNELAPESRPSRAEVEFGLTISAEGNVYVVKGGGEATLRIRAEWELKPGEG